MIRAGIRSDLEGAWPVADDDPCSTMEIAAWCAEFLGIGGVPQAGNDQAVAGEESGREKNPREIGVELTYPSWRTGIPASLEEEERLQSGG